MPDGLRRNVARLSDLVHHVTPADHHTYSDTDIVGKISVRGTWGNPGALAGALTPSAPMPPGAQSAKCAARRRAVRRRRRRKRERPGPGYRLSGWERGRVRRMLLECIRSGKES